MSKLAGKKYPLDVIIDMDKIKRIEPLEQRRGLRVTFKDWTSVDVDRIEELSSK